MSTVSPCAGRPTPFSKRACDGVVHFSPAARRRFWSTIFIAAHSSQASVRTCCVSPWPGCRSSALSGPTGVLRSRSRPIIGGGGAWLRYVFGFRHAADSRRVPFWFAGLRSLMSVIVPTRSNVTDAWYVPRSPPRLASTWRVEHTLHPLTWFPAADILAAVMLLVISRRSFRCRRDSSRSSDTLERWSASNVAQHAAPTQARRRAGFLERSFNRCSDELTLLIEPGARADELQRRGAGARAANGCTSRWRCATVHALAKSLSAAPVPERVQTP